MNWHWNSTITHHIMLNVQHQKIGSMIPTTSYAAYLEYSICSILKCMYFIESFKINRIIPVNLKNWDTKITVMGTHSNKYILSLCNLSTSFLTVHVCVRMRACTCVWCPYEAQWNIIRYIYNPWLFNFQPSLPSHKNIFFYRLLRELRDKYFLL